MVLPNFAEVGSSTEKPPTSVAHSGLNFVGKAGTDRQFSQTADHFLFDLTTTAMCLVCGKII